MVDIESKPSLTMSPRHPDARVGEPIRDKRVLKLIGRYLRAGMVMG